MVAHALASADVTWQWTPAEWIALAVWTVVALAEWLHCRRTVRVAHLAFGPTARPRRWAESALWLRVLAMGAFAWGLASLWLLDPKVHNPDQVPEERIKHLLIALDVSPSMYLQDAGPERRLSRRKRASDVMTSLLDRLPIQEYRISLVAFYSEAKPLLEESTDLEFLRYVFETLPTYQGFKPGKTDLFAGLTLAARTAKKWKPKTTTLIVLSDGMTVPAKGMPRLPASIATTLVVGVGDPNSGKFIDGHQSRQDVTTLRQVAHRLKGIYHNGNLKHLPSSTVRELRLGQETSRYPSWTRREVALAAVAVSGAIIGMLPIMLRYLGTGWNPGVPTDKRRQVRRIKLATAILQRS